MSAQYKTAKICYVFYHKKCLYKVNVGPFSNVFVSVNKRFGSHLCWTGNFPWWEIKYHPHVHFTLFTLQLQNSCLWSLHRDFGVPYHKNIQPTGNWNVKENGFKVVGFIWLPQTGFATLILYLQWSFPSHNNVIWLVNWLCGL